jgi:hypothetical protein
MKRFLLLCSVFVVTSCLRDELHLVTCDPSVPDCVKSKIEDIKKDAPWSPPAKIYRYSYDGKRVYYIPGRCCDIPSILFDESCHTVCSPDGGLSGGGDGMCKDFFDKRINKELIWQDER